MGFALESIARRVRLTQMSDWKLSKKIVGEDESSDRQVVACVDKQGDVLLHVDDLSGPPGMDGYEFYLRVKKEKSDALFLALMDKLYGDRQSCASGFEDLMKKNGIPCERFREWRESKTIVGDEDAANRQVVAYVENDGGVGLQVHDLGGPRGREDSEFYIGVGASERDEVILALIEKIYAGCDSCPRDFEKLMEESGIPCSRYVI